MFYRTCRSYRRGFPATDLPVILRRPMPDRQRSLGQFELHSAVLLFAIAGLFGKWLTLSPLMIVLGRTSFAAMALLIVLIMVPRLRSPIRRGLLPWLALSGCVLAFHWVSFFHAIQISSVAVGLLTFSSFPVFVTLLEPVFFRERLRPIDLLTALIVLTGLICIVPRFDFTNHVTQGACWGVAAGLSFAVVSLLNRRLVAEHSSIVVAAGQNLVAALALLVLLPRNAQAVTPHDLLLLALLGILCTAVAHTLFVQSLTHVRAQLASVVSGLEAIYGTILAYLFLHELPTLRTVIGGALIILAVALGTLRAAEAKAAVLPPA